MKDENDLNDSIPIEFLLPDRPEFSGNFRRIFRVNKRQSPDQVHLFDPLKI